jgi:hypothetical protein
MGKECPTRGMCSVGIVRKHDECEECDPFGWDCINKEQEVSLEMIEKD